MCFRLAKVCLSVRHPHDFEYGVNHAEKKTKTKESWHLFGSSFFYLWMTSWGNFPWWLFVTNFLIGVIVSCLRFGARGFVIQPLPGRCFSFFVCSVGVVFYKHKRTQILRPFFHSFIMCDMLHLVSKQFFFFITNCDRIFLSNDDGNFVSSFLFFKEQADLKFIFFFLRGKSKEWKIM